MIMEKNPPYSVLMSIYYKENPIWLKQSIESIFNQTILCDEFVIVEDGPLTKELYEVIEEYKKKYPKIIKTVKNKENQGLGLALKLGVESCNNELIARIDSDDISVSDRCKKQIERFILNPNLGLIGSNHIEFIDEINNVVSYKKLPITDEEIKKYARRRNPYSHSAVMFKKSKVLQAGNYRDCFYLEDYDLWVRMIENSCICENIDEYLSYVRVSKDLYKRRGGIKYLKSILKFKKELYNKGFYSFKDYFISSTTHIIVCLMPGFMRKLFYSMFLRKKQINKA